MKIVFMGTPQTAVICLERLVDEGHEIACVYTQPDKPAGRGNKIVPTPVKQFALDRAIPVRQPTRIRTQEAFDEFRALGADVAVVVAYGRILPESFLSAFPSGAINVHFSLLPKFRGAAPVNWAIVHGEKKTGVTTMQMDAGLDTGPVLLQAETDIGEHETAIELMQRLAVLGADLLAKTLVEYGMITPMAQNEMDATFAPLMKKEDGLVSWMLSASEISARIRGFQPFPTAFTFLGGRKLTLWKATPVAAGHSLSTPGEILEVAGDNLLVFCGGDSVLRIDELQLEGKRRVSARDFINGVRPGVGDILGS